MTSTASRALGVPEHFACIAAQVGTAIGLGGGASDGLGVGEGVGVGLGAAVAGPDGDGLVVTAVPGEPQAVSANSAAKAITPSLTED